MIPVLSIIGKSNSGKTTLIEKLIVELTKKGYRVATVKHDRSHGFNFDKKGKDSWRHKNAGAVATILSSPKVFVLIRDTEREFSLTEIASRYVENADILIAEGYREGEHNKIELAGWPGPQPKGLPPVAQQKLCQENTLLQVCSAVNMPEDNLSCKKDKTVVALIAEKRYDLNIPQFKRDSVQEIARWIEKEFL